MIPISKALHKKVKLESVRREMELSAMTEQALREFLTRKPKLQGTSAEMLTKSISTGLASRS